MSPEFTRLVAEAHRYGLKVGPMTELPDQTWRVYLQRKSDIFVFRDGETPETAFGAALATVKKDHKPLDEDMFA